MKKINLIAFILLFAGFVCASGGGGGGGGGSNTRVFNYINPANFPNTVYAGDSILVVYTRSPSGSNYWAVDEYMPNGWDTLEQSPVSNRLRFYTNSDNKNYNFIAPNSAGNYNFNDGLYWNYGDDTWYKFPVESITVIKCTATTETCDNKDNNCNYNIDENLSRACSQNHFGLCAIGTERCATGNWGGCPSPVLETCNNLDDDCDNSIDEGLTRSCSQNYLGECAIGTETCSAGAYLGCPTPIDEGTIGSCDGKDNDCDGQIDESRNTLADTNCNGCVENTEFTTYANKWIKVEVSNADFVIVANKWIKLEGCK